MSEPIKPGDLVMVVKPMPCCGYSGSLGHVFMVCEVRASRRTLCHFCQATLSEGRGVAVESAAWIYGIDRLRRIPPLSDLEGQKDSSGLDERQKVGNQLLTGTEFYEALRKMAEGLRS